MMKPLAQKIKALIEKKGPIPFSEYMALCLFDPDYGYYSCLKEIGAKGDFVTAPELGPYFANALAHFIANQLDSFSSPVIVELGGGTGQLAFDLLYALKEKNCLPLRYLIFDKSPSLIALQQQKLREIDFVSIEWIQNFDNMNLQGVILANEFFDALPVERFVKNSSGAIPTFVDWQKDEFVETGSGERFEKCCLFDEVLHPILAAFEQGLALIIDYGAEVIERSTLTAYQNHQVVSPFASPGEADLTAHVNFTDLAESLIRGGWEINFLKFQNQFLLEQGILPEHGIVAENYALKRLLDPRLMGQLFKVLCAHKTACIA